MEVMKTFLNRLIKFLKCPLVLIDPHKMLIEASSAYLT